MQKYKNIYKIQASVQHGLYLFTCEISSVNSINTRTYQYATYPYHVSDTYQTTYPTFCSVLIHFLNFISSHVKPPFRMVYALRNKH